MNYDFYVGSYASAEEDSIYRCRLDTDANTLTRIWAYRGAVNPSYVLPHPNGKILYSVEELTPKGRVAVYAIGETSLTLLQTFPSEGADPCHLALDDQAEFLFVSNYTSGSLAVFRLDDQGKILEMSDHKQHTGSSVYLPRQEQAHVHFSKYSDGTLFVCDLGEDKIYRYGLDAKSGKLTEQNEPVSAPSGSGPRHLTCSPEHPEKLYVVTEMGASLLQYSKDAAGYRLEQNLPALPEGTDIDAFQGGAPRAVGAAIKRNTFGQKTLLAISLRGQNGIAVFHIGDDGNAKLLQISDCAGKTPRDFSVFGNYIIAANQDSDQIRLLKLNAEDGGLKDTGIRADMKSPVCIMPV